MRTDFMSLMELFTCILRVGNKSILPWKGNFKKRQLMSLISDLVLHITVTLISILKWNASASKGKQITVNCNSNSYAFKPYLIVLGLQKCKDIEDRSTLNFTKSTGKKSGFAQ